MTDKTKPPGSEVFDQALKNYEQTLRSGLKLQEETARWWTSLFSQATSAQEFQKRMKIATTEAIPQAQKRMDEFLEMLDQSHRANVALVTKALAVAQATSPSECQSRAMDFCESSLNSMKATSQAVADLNRNLIDSWVGFVKKNAFEFPETATTRA